MVPILTPITPDENIDAPSTRRLIEYLLSSGVHGIWVGGTTGEFTAFTNSQRVTSIQVVVDEVAGRVPIIANVSASSTRLAIELGKLIEDSGVDGIALTPPYYYPSSQDELIQHYREMRNQVNLPLWIYNIPSTVKSTVEPATIIQLASERCVVGIKDSSGAGELLAQLNVLCTQNNIQLLRFIGTIYRLSTAKSVGAHGVIPSLGNLIPSIISTAWEAGEAGNIETINTSMLAITKATQISRLAKEGGPHGSNFSGMKSALKQMGIIDHDNVTKPLRPLSDEEKQSIPTILKEIGLMP